MLPDHDRDRAPQYLFRIEYVIDLLVLQKSIRMDTRAGGIEVPAYERRPRIDVIFQLLFKVICNLRDGAQVHTVLRSFELHIFDRHRFDRAISRALSDAQHRAVDRRRAIQPCRCRIAYDFIEIVVPVPFQQS